MRTLLQTACLLLGASLLHSATAPQQRGGELRFAIQGDPKTLDPLLVDDESSLVLQYLTSGVLIRFNRRTQKLEPELATSWQLDPGGRRITLQLRKGIRFSDGTPFSSADVAYTFQRMMDPAL